MPQTELRRDDADFVILLLFSQRLERI